MYEEVCYEKPFLKEVVVRIDFVAPIDGLEKSLPLTLTKALSHYFPVSEPTEALKQEFQIQGTQVRHTQSSFKQWNFFGKEREKQLALAPEFVFVTYTRYTTYENLKENVAAVVEALGKSFTDLNARRFGLRYVNSIDIQDLPPVTGWKKYITPKLLATDTFFSQPEQLTRLFHIVEFKYGDLDLRFQFGLPNPDYPAVIKRPLFVLDLDAYIETAHDLSESLKYMEQAHKHIQALFEKSITNKLRERMHARSAISIQQ